MKIGFLTCPGPHPGSATRRKDVFEHDIQVDAIPHDVPLYARIDMVREDDGGLLVMEAEMIEPYLYPEQGPNLGATMAEAIERRLGA